MEINTYAAIRLLSSQACNLERVVLGTENQIRMFGQEGFPEAAYSWAEDFLHQGRLIRTRLMKQIVRTAKDTQIGQWQQETAGIGPALYLVIGMIPPLTEFANPAKVWKYCGLSVDNGHAPKMRRKTAAEKEAELEAVREGLEPPKRIGFSSRARSFSLLRIGDPCIKNRKSPYRPIYDARRLRTAVEHPDWTLGHSHADARRVMVKAILRDAWRVSNGMPAKYAGEVVSDAAPPVWADVDADAGELVHA